jgi:hypothetical protein
LIVATPTTCGFKDWSSKLIETGRFLGIEFLGSLPLAPHLDDLEARVFQKLDLPDGVMATQHTFLKALELFSQPNTKVPKT